MNERMYEGKAKILYETDDKTVSLMHFKDDITAGDGEKKDTMNNKGKLNCTISKKIFEYLEKQRLKKVISSVKHLFNQYPKNISMTSYY